MSFMWFNRLVIDHHEQNVCDASGHHPFMLSTSLPLKSATMMGPLCAHSIISFVQIKAVAKESGVTWTNVTQIQLETSRNMLGAAGNLKL